VIFESRAVEGVGAGFNLDVNRGAAGEALFGVEGVGYDVDTLDGLEGGDVGNDVGEPYVGRRGTVDAGVVGTGTGAVDVELEGARGVGGDGVGVAGRGETGDGDEEALVVAARGDGDVLELSCRNFGADFGAVRLQGSDGGFDGDGVANLADLEAGVLAGYIVDYDGNTLFALALEAIFREGEFVSAREESVKRIGSVLISSASAELSGVGVLKGEPDAGHGGAGGVPDGSDQGAVENLGPGRSGTQQERGKSKSSKTVVHGNPLEVETAKRKRTRLREISINFSVVRYKKTVMCPDAPQLFRCISQKSGRWRERVSGNTVMKITRRYLLFACGGAPLLEDGQQRIDAVRAWAMTLPSDGSLRHSRI